MVIIPLRGDLPHYTLQVDLDGRTFGFELLWNFRDEAWYMSVTDADGAPLVSGLKLVIDFPLAIRCRDARKFPGSLFAQDTSGAHRESGMPDLGSRVQVYYFPAGEL